MKIKSICTCQVFCANNNTFDLPVFFGGREGLQVVVV